MIVIRLDVVFEHCCEASNYKEGIFFDLFRNILAILLDVGGADFFEVEVFCEEGKINCDNDCRDDWK